jgi:hypothetical protein
MPTSENRDMQDCIDACLSCHRMCLQMAMTRCLQLGGKHTEPEHFRLMLNCAELCQTSANFMLSGSSIHSVVCAACAEVCRRCADDCEKVGDMDECVRECRKCAERCEEMGAG